MKKYTDPLVCDQFYHVFNRGINREDIFKEDRNYAFFLRKYFKYIEPVAETYAYCFLKNHFHFLIRTRSVEEIIRNVGKIPITVGIEKLPIIKPAYAVVPTYEKFASILISRKFSNFFNCYAQAFNKAYKRTGGLFEEPFRRIPVENLRYCTYLVKYIHRNPQKHDFVDDFRDYPYSSFHSFFSDEPTSLKKEEVFSWFGNPENFMQYHLNGDTPEDLQKLEIEPE